MLPGKLSGPAYLVSHGSEEFPNLDLVLRGDGVEVVLVGHTFISPSGITSSAFESVPDVPVSSVLVDLPVGPGSLLAANVPPCTQRLLAQTTIVAQNGAKVSRAAKIGVSGCPVRVLAHRTRGGRVILTVQTPAAGRLSVTGGGVAGVSRRVRRAGTVTVSVPLTGSAAASLQRGRRVHVHLRIGFRPAAGARSAASLSVALR